MADIQDALQATLFLSLPVVLILFCMTTLVLVVLYYCNRDNRPVLAKAATTKKCRPSNLPRNHTPTYRTFSDSGSSYAADDEGSARTGRRATASIIHSPTLPTIEDDASSYFEPPRYCESPSLVSENTSSAYGSERNLDAVLTSSETLGTVAPSASGESVDSGEDVPRGRVRKRIGSGGSAEIISRWLGPRWREQSVDVEGQRSIGNRTERRQ